MVTVVVTGASGFLGDAVVTALRRRPYVKVQPVSRRPMAGTLRVDRYSEAPGADVLIHLAEESDRSLVERLGVEYADEMGATAGALLDGRYQHVVYASSAVLYGDRSSHAHAPDDPVYVKDAYTRIKRATEIAVLDSPTGVVARVANVYGPGMSTSNVMSRILAQIPGSGAVRVADLTPVRDFVWIEDVAEAFVALATVEGPAGVFNVGTGLGISVGALARIALDVANERDREITATGPPNSSTIVLDCARTAQAYAWLPHVDVRGGLSVLMSGAPRAEARHTR
jgi:UDP-glucose 4-epimerase